MSSSIFDKQTATPPSTRRAPTVNNDADGQRTAGRRSLSGKFRSLFRRNSQSPKRAASNVQELSPPPPPVVRTRSPSVGSSETPQLRAPTIAWPFGKKAKSTPKTPSPPPSTKNKTKVSRKSKKKPAPVVELPAPAFERLPSFPSYELTPTKGFRDYMVIDQSKPFSSSTVNEVNVDHSPSSSVGRTGLPTISQINLIVKPQEEPSSLTASQLLAGKAPLLPVSQSKYVSTPALSDYELHSTTSSSMEMDSPKLRPPIISFGTTATSTDGRPKRTVSPSREENSYTSTGSLQQQPFDPRRPFPDAEMMTTSPLTSAKPMKSSEKYPGLSAIIQHHLRPISVQEGPQRRETQTFLPMNAERPPRFEASTTTMDIHEPRLPPSSVSPTHSNDGFIRPLTPQRPSSASNALPERPTIYRSSATIFTKDKHQYVDGGEIRTWSVREGNIDDDSTKPYSRPSSAIHVERLLHQEVPSNFRDESGHSRYQTTDRDYRYGERTNPVQQYAYETPQSSERAASFVSPAVEHMQEPQKKRSPAENYQAVPRHYTLKRTDSYDGLGILISADADTRLHHSIRDVEPASPAYRAGLRRNDRIVGVNGIDVENVEFSDVLILIKQGLNNNNLQFSVVNESTVI